MALPGEGPRGHGSDDELEVSDEDIEFVKRSGGRVGFLERLNQKELDKWVCRHH